MPFSNRKSWLFLLLCVAACVGCGPPPANPDEGKSFQPGPVDADAVEAFTTTDSGLKYRVRRDSAGKKPGKNSRVSVYYKGWLDDGTEFDSSYAKGGGAVSFYLDGVIEGWTEGLQLIGVGGMIELEVPPELGYGARGFGSAVPPNARLHFLVELIETS